MQTLIDAKTQSWLIWFLRGVLILGFLILFARLVDLQIIRGVYFRSLAEGNRIRRVPILAPRGKILARGGETLVSNSQIGISREGTEEPIAQWKRDYLLGKDFAHVSGYLGEVNEEEVGKIQGRCPDKGPRSLGSWVGRTGLEQKYDCILSGNEGEELIEVDAQGIPIRSLGRRNPIPGQDLKTTIDFGLQEKVAKLIEGKKGAILVTDVKGEVLALYSSPSFDPNMFVAKDSESISKILTDTSLPLFNRSIGGMYHPGSVFKPIVAIAALEEGKVDKDFLYEDTGQITIKSPYGVFTYKNWYFTQYGGTEGKIGLTRAIARSTDTFFYKLGELVGAENLNSWAQKFGLADKTGIDLPGEIPGLVPSPEWKLKVKGERWFLGNTYHMSIGQGDIALTPIAVNSAVAAIASGGSWCKPHIVSGEELGSRQCRDLGISEKTLKLVKEGMVGVCTQGGTGFTFFDFKQKSGIDIACKTGTAETQLGEPHAWFVAFGPVDNPEIVVTVILEEAGEGSKVAGPVAREIFNYWFKVQTSGIPTPTPTHE